MLQRNWVLHDLGQILLFIIYFIAPSSSISRVSHCHTALQRHLFYWHFYPAIPLIWWHVISFFSYDFNHFFFYPPGNEVPGFNFFIKFKIANN